MEGEKTLLENLDDFVADLVERARGEVLDAGDGGDTVPVKVSIAERVKVLDAATKYLEARPKLAPPPDSPSPKAAKFDKLKRNFHGPAAKRRANGAAPTETPDDDGGSAIGDTAGTA